MALACVFAVACKEPTKPTKHGTDEPRQAHRCQVESDCAAEERCFQSLCVSITQTTDTDVAPPVAHLRATPVSLAFGAVPPGSSQRLLVILENDGDAMVTLEQVRIEPPDVGFHVAPLGTGPFWIRPGRSREVFVDFMPQVSGAQEAVLVVGGGGVAVTIVLRGN